MVENTTSIPIIQNQNQYAVFISFSFVIALYWAFIAYAIILRLFVYEM